MRGLCGWWADLPSGQGDAALAAMLAAHRPAAVEARWRTGPGCGTAVFDTVSTPQFVESEGAWLAATGHPRLRGSAGGLEELLDRLRRDGRAALQDIVGDFALAFWDGRSRAGLIAVDRIGVQPMVHGRAGAGFVFGTTLDMLGGFPGIRRELTSQGLFDYLFYHVSPGPETVFAGLRRVPPGHCVEWRNGRAGEPSAYWTMRFEEDDSRSFDQLKREFVTALQDSVAEAAAGVPSGSFLSGGTDSSTVSGMLARYGNAPARTFSIGFDVAGYDEMEYARIAARHFGCEHHEYYVTPQDVVDAVPRIAASYDQPFGNASAIPTYYCAKFARESGITRLLAGDGGDELFGGNERYGKQYLLSLYGRLPGALRGGLVEPLLGVLPGVQKIMPLRKLASYVQQARPPMPDRYASYNLLMYLGYANIFTPEFLASVDTGRPGRLLAEAHAPYADASLVNQMLGIDLRFTLWDGDLPKVTHMCELAGVDVAYPLLDERVVDFSRRLASDLKLRRTTLRWFFKQALLDFLPPQIITKQKHGFGLPVGAWITGHPPLRALAADSIELLRRRGVVRPEFIDELMSDRLREHAAYFGTMVWVLMMLGIWLDSRRL